MSAHVFRGGVDAAHSARGPNRVGPLTPGKQSTAACCVFKRCRAFEYGLSLPGVTLTICYATDDCAMSGVSWCVLSCANHASDARACQESASKCPFGHTAAPVGDTTQHLPPGHSVVSSSQVADAGVAAGRCPMMHCSATRSGTSATAGRCPALHGALVL